MIRILFLDFTHTYGLKACPGELISNVSLPAELQSDVLLLCFFESDLLISAQANQTCVVWTQRTTADTYIVEISLGGIAKFWDRRQGRIKTESKLLDFSINIRNVTQSDLGVYHCQLFTKTSCLLAYKRIELHTVNFWWPWMIIAGAAGSGAMLLLLIVFAIKFFKCRTVDGVTYASVIYRSHNSHESNVLAHDNHIQPETEESTHVISDSVLYSTIRRGH